ncbi:MAG TPA: L-threonylcarbamoyladenylate synthase [Gemmatimonadales bacterium]|jgi:L-threonylcarbamoyladenylate synthase|nr:L-threonylcarbamoyladenylate synthase [Gemmatimonadales bacterium]
MTLPFLTPAEVEAATPRVREHLEADRLLAYPTETVYGLGSAPRPAALAALAALKGRPPQKPFLLLVSGRVMAERWGLVFNAPARALSDAFWPGPLTLVLPGGEGHLPEALRGTEGGIAVRHTSHPGIARLVAALDFPLTSTSANRPGGPTAPGAPAIADLFADAVASGELLVLDGGVLGNVPPSTLVDCTTKVPRLVREGALPRGELRRAVGRLAP